LDYFDVSVPPFLQGQSLLKDMEAIDEMQGRTVFMEFGRHSINNEFFGGFQPIQYAFDGRHKLVLNLQPVLSCSTGRVAPTGK
jgi:hypothetical protein